MTEQRILGIDVGGTGIKAAVVELQRDTLAAEPLYYATPQPSKPAAVFGTIREIIDALQWPGSVGCGFPGIIKGDSVYMANNLDDSWEGVHFKREWQKYIKNKVSLINDADAAAMAEMYHGAGKAYTKNDSGIVILLTLGTGIGSGVFVNGQLMPNVELGLIEFEGDMAEKSVATVIKERENLSWQTWAQRLDRYLRALEIYFSPNLFIIGGGISDAHEQFFPLLTIKTKIKAAQLGNQAGIIGAALHCSYQERD
jgi:polyphosphate glucokinase